ncbi:PIG-L deacetylase family protein [Arthrobacter castelli]|uniref:PIG-L deacetylase family protein n=1 Tax=Arthrobacter castelli TaxID=271431 RepID=UPI00041F184A|nr:PIG-L family deacetylase [Arthrobacter castelli]
MEDLENMPDDWTRALLIMAHPDDAEYGAGAAVAEWTAAGKEVAYVLASKGEAGIAPLPPAESARVREAEQRRACEAVGVDDLTFLGYPDGRIEQSLALRRDFAREIRRFKPHLVITLNHHDTWAPGAWNSADHRAVGRSVLDAAADASNAWIFEELKVDGFAPWDGVRWVAVMSMQPTHVTPVSADSVARAVDSLAEHEQYLQALSSDPVREQAQRQVDMVTGGDPDQARVAFELYNL